jgi:hypothetical protein
MRGTSEHMRNACNETGFRLFLKQYRMFPSLSRLNASDMLLTTACHDDCCPAALVAL